MRTLRYISLQKAADIIGQGMTIVDGTVVIADCGRIETHGNSDPDIEVIEHHAENSNWIRRWGHGVYHYELLIARKGTTRLTDQNGDECGFVVNGSDRGIL